MKMHSFNRLCMMTKKWILFASCFVAAIQPASAEKLETQPPERENPYKVDR